MSARPFSAYERMIAWRYLRARRREGGVSVMSIISLVGVSLAVFALIATLAVRSGFRTEFVDPCMDEQFPDRIPDRLIDELKAADTIVIGLPVYNFGVPSGLKAWIDLVARAGATFRYTEAGPEGLLAGKRAIVAMASGGTEAGSAIDFATPYLRHVLGFIGITEVELVRADRLAFDAEGTLKAAQQQVAGLAA